MADEPEDEERIVAAVGSAAGVGSAKAAGETLTKSEFDRLVDSISERLDAIPDNAVVQLNVTKDSLTKVIGIVAYVMGAITKLEESVRDIAEGDKDHAGVALNEVAEFRGRAADAYALAFDALLKVPGQR